MLYAESKINIESFYGLEIDDFAVEVAILSLWIAKHQMNAEFKEKFNLFIPLIPLKETGKIQPGNATRVDWNDVCPNDGGEIYLIGNPPYKGAKTQTKEMKADFPHVFGRRSYSKNMDYIALWFTKGADYIQGTRAELAFVTTNSVAQGEHVGLMFPRLFDMGLEIGYAYTSFKWENNAKRNAGVTVSVISLRNVRPGAKYIFADGVRMEATNINGYLANGSNIFIGRRKSPMDTMRPAMVFGSMPRASGLVLTSDDRQQFISRDTRSGDFIKAYIGTKEHVDGIDRYCLWIDDDQADAARAVPAIAERLARVAEERSRSEADSTASYAARPHRFVQISYRPTESIIVPSVSSERREYIPFGYLDKDVVVSNLAFAVYDAEPWVFALLTSRMHMTWTRAVGGQHETRLRYSNTIVYNNFPVPPLSGTVKETLTIAALRILDVREYHCERTLAELYDPDLMPEDLRKAHTTVDDLVDSIYSKKRYETDEQRLSDLFAIYEEMTAAETIKGKKK